MYIVVYLDKDYRITPKILKKLGVLRDSVEALGMCEVTCGVKITIVTKRKTSLLGSQAVKLMCQGLLDCSDWRRFTILLADFVTVSAQKLKFTLTCALCLPCLETVPLNRVQVTGFVVSSSQVVSHSGCMVKSVLKGRWMVTRGLLSYRRLLAAGLWSSYLPRR